jgi:putative membrane protein insertion efficiency factor
MPPNEGNRMHPSNSSLADGLRPAIIALRILPRRAMHVVIRAYQLTFSALVGRQCRHAPSCSAYMDEAIERHGVWAGGLLGLARVCRCHPWGTSGYDPVPEHLPNRSLGLFIYGLRRGRSKSDTEHAQS